jgi:hypothetical protein
MTNVLNMHDLNKVWKMIECFKNQKSFCIEDIGEKLETDDKVFSNLKYRNKTYIISYLEKYNFVTIKNITIEQLKNDLTDYINHNPICFQFYLL